LKLGGTSEKRSSSGEKGVNKKKKRGGGVSLVRGGPITKTPGKHKNIRKRKALCKGKRKAK